jgi:DNA polymerase III subunit gamma/tau
MNYIVTARKWRPNRFDEVIGQEHITITLKNAIKNNKIAHAYLFAGPRGVGKTTTARILAKTLNCTSPKDTEPCNSCEMCNSFNSSQSLDIIEIDGASNRRIDEIRSLRESVKYAPTKGKYKVYIIDEVHMLTTESFNALLKTLEEPPEHTIFIFATTDIQKVPLTIISRCQRFDFRRIELSPMKSLLKKIAEEEKIEIDDQSLTIIAKKADGALRDAESLFDQIVAFSGHKIEAQDLSTMLNLIDEEVFFIISDSILDKKYISGFEVTKQIYEKGWNFVDFISGLIEHFRNILTVNLSGKVDFIECADIYKERYLNFKNKFSEGDLLRILNYLNKTQQELRFTQNQKLKIEVSLCSLIGLEKSSTIKDAIEKLEETKKKIPHYSVSDNIKSDSSSENLFNEPSTPVLPKVNSDIKSISVKPILNNNENEENADLTKKWRSFIDIINQEKLIVGSALSNIKVHNIEGKVLHIQTSDASINNIISQNEQYINQKLRDFLGQDVTLNNIINIENKHTKIAQRKSNISNNFVNNKISEESPLIAAIINELGGEEIE